MTACLEALGLAPDPVVIVGLGDSCSCERGRAPRPFLACSASVLPPLCLRLPCRARRAARPCPCALGLPEPRRPGTAQYGLGSPGLGCGGAAGAAGWPWPLRAVGLQPCSFLPSSLRLETPPPPRTPGCCENSSCSPQVIFPSRGSEELGSAGGKGGGHTRHPLTPSHLWRGGPGTSLMGRRGRPWHGGHVVAGGFFGRRFGG